MYRYFKLFNLNIKISLMRAMVYRINFFLMFIQNIVNILVTILSIHFVYNNITEVAGWSRNEMIVLICTAQIINGLYRGMISPNLGMLSNAIRQGSFDFVLLKPVNIFFQILVGRVDYSSLFSIVVPIYLISRQLQTLQYQVSWINIVGYIFFLFLGLLLISFLMLGIFSLAFIFVNVSKLDELYYTFMAFIEKPKEIFNNYLGTSLFFVIPLVPVANTPAVLLLERWNWNLLFKSIGVVFIFVLISRMMVVKGIAKYESASS